MNRAFWVFAVLVLAGVCRAESIEKFFYIGEMKLTSPAGKPMGSQAFLFEKTHDPDKGMVVERAIVAGADGKVEEYVMDINVSGNSVTIADRKGTVKGTGELFGPAWAWSYFKADYRINNGVRVLDENFMTDPSMITARKQVFSPDGKPIMFMEGTFKSITPQTFQLLSAALLSKSATTRPTH